MAEVTTNARSFFSDGMSLAFRAFFALPTDIRRPRDWSRTLSTASPRCCVSLVRTQRPRIRCRRLRPTWRHLSRRDDAGLQGRPRRDPARARAAVRPHSHDLRDAAHTGRRRRAASRPTTYSRRSRPGAATTELPVVVVTGDRDAFQLVEDPYVRGALQPARASRTTRSTTRPGSSSVRRRGAPLPAPRRLARRHLGQPARRARAWGRRRRRSSSPSTATWTTSTRISTTLTPKLRENLAAYEERARNNERVMRLMRDVPLDWSLCTT